MKGLFVRREERLKADGRASAKNVGMPWGIIAIAIIVATVLVVLAFCESGMIKSGNAELADGTLRICLLYTSPSPRD